MCKEIKKEVPAKVEYRGQCHTVKWVEKKGLYRVAKIRSRFAGDTHFMSLDEVLKLRPWADFKAAKEAKQKRQPRGECQICGQSYGTKAGVVAHHGYQRPGWGFHTKGCYGGRRQPYEESRNAIPHYIYLLEVDAERLETKIDELSAPGYAGPVVARMGRKTRELMPEDRLWDFTRKEQIRSSQHQLAAIRGEIEHLGQRFDNWTWKR